MRIDWTQTMIGSSALLHEADQDQTGKAGDRAATPFALTRLAGLLSVSTLIGFSIASMPWRGSVATLPEILALSGFLLAHVAGLLSAARFGWRKAVTSMALALPFAIFAGLSVQVLAALSVLVVLDGVATHVAAGRSRFAAIAPAGVAIFVALASLGFARTGTGGAMLVLAALVPTLATAVLCLARREENKVELAQTEIARLNALLQASAEGGTRQMLVTDIVGTLDPLAAKGFEQHLHAEMFPEGSVVAATLIADRVQLLNALSRAIHSGERTESLRLRVRRDPAGAGYPMPPRYDAVDCAVYPMPGVADRAVVALGVSGAMASDAAPVVATSGLPDAAVLARAMHDCTAPFNAGLGFLEMIADPRLAPRDIATYRDFAAEAHKAISEAHRNSVLLGRWLRQVRAAEEPVEMAEIAPARLVQDGIRGLNLRDAVDRGELRVIEAESLPVAAVSLVRARFAVEVLLRFAQGQARSEVRLSRQGHDLVLTCRAIGEDADDVAVDAFQDALEKAASTGNLHFTAAEGGRERRLLLTDAFPVSRLAAVDGLPVAHEAVKPVNPVRLAS